MPFPGLIRRLGRHSFHEGVVLPVKIRRDSELAVVSEMGGKLRLITNSTIALIKFARVVLASFGGGFTIISEN